jgi:hypothetical protein
MGRFKLIQMKNGRGKDYGTGWDGHSRIPDETYKKNYNQIDWSDLIDEKKIKKNIDIYVKEHKRLKNKE